MALLTFVIATVFILEHASILLASPSHPSNQDALDNAFYQFISSGTRNVVHQKLLLSTEVYSVLQLTEFILTHRLV